MMTMVTVMEEVREKIFALDFTNTKRKLSLPEPEGKGWSEAQCEQAELWYKRFLYICAAYPDHPAVPNGPIDEFWHYHILDTMKYTEDCDSIFGFYLHHYPYFGLNGDADVRDNSFDITNDFYMNEFGDVCTNMPLFFSDFSEERAMGCKVVCGSGCKRPMCRNEVKAKGCHAEVVNCGPCGEVASPIKAKGCSGEGCVRGCGKRCKSVTQPAKASNCGHKGSGTGCGQGCGRRT